MRRRDIDPLFWQDEKAGSVSIGAQLLFIWTWNDADDWGVLRWRDSRCKSGAFLYRPRINLGHVRDYMRELVDACMIVPWEVGGECWCIVRNFLRHQSVNRPIPAKVPAPPSDVVAMLPPPIEWRGCEKLYEKLLATPDNFPPWIASCMRDRSPVPSSGSVPPVPPPEEKDQGKNISKATPSHPAKPGKRDDINAVFEHWKTTMSHPRAQLDAKRKATIGKALDSYTVADCILAIDGCAKTPHNMGQNDRNERYDAIDLILRDAAHIDRFMANAAKAPAAIVPPVVDEHAAQSAAKREWDRLANTVNGRQTPESMQAAYDCLGDSQALYALRTIFEPGIAGWRRFAEVVVNGTGAEKATAKRAFVESYSSVSPEDADRILAEREAEAARLAKQLQEENERRAKEAEEWLEKATGRKALAQRGAAWPATK